jgi:hypothetical protein
MAIVECKKSRHDGEIMLEFFGGVALTLAVVGMVCLLEALI